MVQPVWSVHSNTARLPTRLDDIRFMFKSDERVDIPPGAIRSVSTGVGFTIPNNIGGLVYPLSGVYSLHFPRFLKSTHGLPLEIKVINMSGGPMTIDAGQDIVKMLCQQIVNFQNFPFNVNADAIEPVRHADSTGWVLKSPVTCTIAPNASNYIDTGISTPGVEGYNAYVYPLHEFCTSNYIVDNNNNNSLHVRLMNCSSDPINIEIGEPIGLLTLNEAVPVLPVVVQVPMDADRFRTPLSPINRRG